MILDIYQEKWKTTEKKHDVLYIIKFVCFMANFFLV